MKNILIVKLSAIGDVVHALPIAGALKKCLPDCRITWVVEKAAYDLLDSHPYIDEVILFDKPAFKSISGLLCNAPRFLAELRRRKFDVALDLQGLLKSALIGWGSGAAQRYVYENSREGSDRLAKRVVGMHAAAGHVTERYLDVARHLGCSLPSGVADYGLKILPEEMAAARRMAAHNGLDMTQRYGALILGANWPNKIWPQEHFAALADAMYAEGIIPVLVGGPGDAQLAALTAKQCAIPPLDLTGKTTLKQLSAILQQAAVVVGGDTGPLHLAAALGAPTLALMGPTDEQRNGPYGKGNAAMITPRSCAGCWQRTCPKQWDCLAAIEPEAVWQMAKKLLAREKNGGA